MTQEVLSERETEYHVRSWKMIPSSGGVFEITVNGELVFSKKTLGRHAEPGEAKAAILNKMNALRGV